MKTNKAYIKWFLISLCGTLLLLYSVRNLTLEKQHQKLGEQAVKLMYQFTETQQLALNMVDLKAITTEPVFNQLTIDNENRSLLTYVKFKGETTSVNIIKSGPDYVLYSLKNDNIAEDRRFIFMFDCNKSGKISYVREAEINDFVTYLD